MAKGSRNLNIEKMIKDGRSSGIGSEYKPWITIQDVPSLGRSTRLKGIKTKRQHEFLSDMERNYFYILEYSDDVKDIREQFPLLPLEETLLIAKELGLEHPKHSQTGEYIVMTTDFLITKEVDGILYNFARTIKAKDELLNRRVIEKFNIEKVYWQRKNIDWATVTDEDINKSISKNISYFLSYYDLKTLDVFSEMNDNEIQDLLMEYLRRIIDTEKTIRSISTLFDEDMSLPKGTGISIFKHLLSRKIISIDLTSIINIDKKIDIKIKERVLDKELIIS